MRYPHVLSAIIIASSLPVLHADESLQAVPSQTKLIAKNLDKENFNKAHPFLSSNRLPSWSEMTPDKMLGDVKLAIEKTKAEIAKICAQTPESSTYANTFEAYDNLGRELNWAEGRISVLESLCDSSEFRKKMDEVRPILAEFSSTIPLNAQLYKALESYSKKALEGKDSTHKITECEKRFIEETLKGFRESGANLPEDKKKHLAALHTKHAELTQKYAQNTMDATNSWEHYISKPEDLKGLPQRFLDGAHAAAVAKGKGSTPDGKKQYLLTLQTSSRIPVLQYAENPELRKLVWKAGNDIGSGKFDNEKLVWEILALRAEIAKILGYSNFADMTTSDRMAKTGKNAVNFIKNLHTQSVKHYRQEMEDLRKFQEEKSGQKVEKLSPWDISYWSEKMRLEKFHFDAEELRPYYQLDKAMDGLFSLVQKLYNISIKPVESYYIEPGKTGPKNPNGVEVWHPEVKVYSITDNKTKKQIGIFYADWHPRESKRGGAWMAPLDSGVAASALHDREINIGMICGNLSAPINGKPALIDHRELETVFHEFGHLMHFMLSEVPVRSLGGTSVAWDFVEFPSQIMENWTWDKEGLDLFARHNKTGEKIPDELFQKMLNSRNFMSGANMLGQLNLAILDLELHINPEKYLGKDIDEIDNELSKDYRVEMTDNGQSILRRIPHLFGRTGGYPAGYYSYKWAEVLEADAFTLFHKEGITNSKIGQSFRENVLSKGNSKPADELFRNFMGRNPDPEALLKRSGLK